MIQKFHEFNLNESFRDNTKGMSLDDMMNNKPSYKDNVASYLINIITNERGISEKSFGQYDEVIKEVEDFYEENKNDLDIIIKEFEENGCRKTYCAEKIYCDYFSDSLNEAKKKTKKKSKDFKNANKPEDLKKIMNGVSLGKDKNGYFVYTHRARSKSYKNAHDIPKSKIKFIETTG